MAKEKLYTNHKGESGVWRTIADNKVFIRKGQSLTEAMRQSGLKNMLDRVEVVEQKHSETTIETTEWFEEKILPENKEKIISTIEELQKEYPIMRENFSIQAIERDENSLASAPMSGDFIAFNSKIWSKETKVDSDYSLSLFKDVRDTVNHEVGHVLVGKMFIKSETLKGLTAKEISQKYASFNRKIMTEVEREASKLEFGVSRARLRKYDRASDWTKMQNKLHLSEYSQVSYAEQFAENFTNYRYKKTTGKKLNNYEKAFENVLEKELAKYE